MELRDQFQVRASADDVWGLFWDLPRIAKCLPGCEDIQAIDDTHYQARIVQKVGPFQLAMDLDLSVQEVVEGERVVVAGGGRDRMGNMLKLTRLSLELQPGEGDQTTITYLMDFNLYGRLASLGSSVIKRKAEEKRAEFTKRIIAELEPGAS